jgi:transposase
VTDITRVGLDTAKSVFQVHGVDAAEQPVLRRQLRRAEMIKFFEKLRSWSRSKHAVLPTIGHACQ